VLAQIEAGRGERSATTRSAAAVGMIEATDMLALQGLTWRAHADVLSKLGRVEEAQGAESEAVARYERKGAVAPWRRD
jgi:predicted RNA polymerase sigma factor